MTTSELTAFSGDAFALPASRKKTWLINPWVDLLFCCGGGVWLITAAVYWNGGLDFSPYNAWGKTFLTLSLIIQYCFADPHTAASYQRLYSSAGNMGKWWIEAFLLPLFFLGILIYGLTHLSTGPVFAKVYTIWVMQHWMAQIFGIGLIYFYRADYRLTKAERWLYWLIMHSTAASVVINACLPTSGPSFFLVPLPYWGPLPPWMFDLASAVFAVSTTLFVFAMLRRWILFDQLPPWPAILLSITGVMIQLPHLTLLNSAKLYIVGFYHGAQYLVVAAAYYLKEQEGEASPAERVGTLLFASKGIKYWAKMIVGGILIYSVFPKVIQDFFGIPVAKSFPIIFGVVNFHHFLVDGAIWKLRKPEIRKVLVPSTG